MKIAYIILFLVIIVTSCTSDSIDDNCTYDINDYLTMYKNLTKVKKLKNEFYLIDERILDGSGGVYIFNNDSILHEYMYFNNMGEIIYNENYKEGKLINFQGSPMVTWYSNVKNNQVYLYIFVSSINKTIDSPKLQYKDEIYNLTLHEIKKPLQSNLKFVSIYLKGVKESQIKDNNIIFLANYKYCNGGTYNFKDTL